MLVAGFLAGGTDDVDGNLETTRLLRSQLRTKSELRVIDADVLPLMDVAARAIASATPAQPLPNPIKDDKDLDQYEHVFADAGYWKKVGEEYQQPLIVTGTVMFTSRAADADAAARAGGLRHARPAPHGGGAAARRTKRVRTDRPVRLHRRPHRRDAPLAELHESILYDANRQTPALSSYFELMDKLIPNFLATLSSQKIKGTRILLN